MERRQPQRLQVQLVQLPLVLLQRFVVKLNHHYLLHQDARAPFPLHHPLLHYLYLFYLLGEYSQILPFLNDVLKGVLRYFVVAIPVKASQGFFFYQSVATYTLINQVIFCLMLFQADTLNVKPLLTVTFFTLNHSCILVGLAVPTYTIFLWVFNADEIGCEFTFQEGFCSFNFLQITNLIFLCLTSNCCISIFSVIVVAFPFLFYFWSSILLCQEGYLFIVVEGIGLSLPFEVPYFRALFFIYLFLSFFCLNFLCLQNSE